MHHRAPRPGPDLRLSALILPTHHTRSSTSSVVKPKASTAAVVTTWLQQNYSVQFAATLNPPPTTTFAAGPLEATLGESSVSPPATSENCSHSEKDSEDMPRRPLNMVFPGNNNDSSHRILRSSVAEDDSSLSSTFAVECCPARQTPSTPSPTTTELKTQSTAMQRKSVSFNENLNQVHAPEDYYCQPGTSETYGKDDCMVMWYTHEEYRHFKTATVYMSREITKAELKNRAPYSYQRVILRAYDACCTAETETDQHLLGEEDRKHLRRWYEVASSRIGLERWAIREIGHDKTFRRTEIVDAVLEVQHRSRLLAGTTAEQQAADICCTSKSISRVSRLFARTLADAQAEATKRQNTASSELAEQQ